MNLMEPGDSFADFADFFARPVGADAPSCKLAAALADRIGEVLPSPLLIRATGPDLDLYADDRHDVVLSTPRLVDDEDDRTFGEKVETAAASVLSSVQDVVSCCLVEQWPPDADGRMADANARVDKGRVHLWYGIDQAAAVITLRPIELASLMR